MAWHKWRRLPPEQIVRIATIPSSHLQNVTKAASRKQPHDRAGTRHQRIKPNGRTMKEIMRALETFDWYRRGDGG